MDWLPRHSHETDRDEETLGMRLIINTIESCADTPDCMTGEEIRIAMPDDKYICMLSEVILHIWPLTTAEVQKDPQPYWSFIDEIAIIDGIAVKDRRIMKLVALQDKTLKQLHMSHIRIERTRLMAQ